ncbi:OmpA family protein [Cellulomonas soli]
MTHKTTRRRHGRVAAAVALLGLAAPTALAAPAVAADDGQSWHTKADLGLPAAPAADILDSLFTVREYTDLDNSLFTVRAYSLERSVRPLETVEHEASGTVVTLASDILFASDSAELSEAARTAVAALVVDIPQGAALAVRGHTDSVDTDEYNLTLSQARAQAVAAVIATARPDLVLDVAGLGESQPAVAEVGDEVAAARAANRRVELRYAG